MTIKNELKNVYRASDCMDTNDVRAALDQCTEIVKRTGLFLNGKGMMYKRICALYRRGEYLHRRAGYPGHFNA